MNVITLSFKNIIARPWWSALSLILLVLGVGMIDLMGHLEEHFNKTVSQNTAGIDMVVGAKGSPLQLILSSVLHIDAPTGNIPYHSLETLRGNRLVEKAIPLSYGDNYMGNRIVGTEATFLELYGLKIQEGKSWDTDFEVVIGNEVARKTGLGIGDRFSGAHGLQEGGHAHDEHSYQVVGVLAASGTVADHLILTSQESVWHIHAHKETSGHQENRHDKQEEHHQVAEREITAILVTFRNPMGVIQLPRRINQLPHLQAAVPAIEMNRLLSLMGVGVDTLKVISGLIMLIGATSIFITLLATMQDRKFEMAFMRAYGASRRQLAGLVLGESVTLALTGALLGLVFSRLGAWMLSSAMEENYHFRMEIISLSLKDVKIILAIMALGIAAAIIPAFQAFRLNISKTLANV